MSELPELGPVSFARWAWRQLTSMRTALLLLLLLAVVAIPGSLVPQRSVDSLKVDQYFAQHPKLAPLLDKLDFFTVYSSPWFSAVYLLLMISLVGCIIPRIAVYARQLRARPPAAPSNFSRLKAHESFTTLASREDILTASRSMLNRGFRRQRIDVVDTEDGFELSAERGYLREFGNLVFHTSIVVVLVGVAITNLWGYRGLVVAVEGDGFSNSVAQYSEFTAGAMTDPENLAPFTIKVDTVTAKFRLGGNATGAPEFFGAQGVVTSAEGNKKFAISVNHPLSVDQTNVYLVGQGYAPVIKVTDAEGNVVFNDAVVFLPQDPSYTSSGVIKVPDAKPTQMGFEGFFIPTAIEGDKAAASRSALPQAANPLLGMFMWTGDLGLNNGKPQSVFTIDKSKMTQAMGTDGDPFKISLSEGQIQDLPGGGSIEFTGLKQWGRFQVAHTPYVWLPLLGVSLGVLGLMTSLFVRPQRTWLRARRTASGTVVELAALDRLARDDLADELREFAEQLSASLGVVAAEGGEEKA